MTRNYLSFVFLVSVFLASTLMAPASAMECPLEEDEKKETKTNKKPNTITESLKKQGAQDKENESDLMVNSSQEEQKAPTLNIEYSDKKSEDLSILQHQFGLACLLFKTAVFEKATNDLIEEMPRAQERLRELEELMRTRTCQHSKR